MLEMRDGGGTGLDSSSAIVARQVSSKGPRSEKEFELAAESVRMKRNSWRRRKEKREVAGITPWNDDISLYDICEWICRRIRPLIGSQCACRRALSTYLFTPLRPACGVSLIVTIDLSPCCCSKKDFCVIETTIATHLSLRLMIEMILLYASPSLASDPATDNHSKQLHPIQSTLSSSHVDLPSRRSVQ